MITGGSPSSATKNSDGEDVVFTDGEDAVPPTKRPLPAGWRWVRLGEVCEVKGGKRLPPGADFALATTPFPYIRVIDFQNGTVNVDSLKYIDDVTRQQIARYIIRRDDVFLSIAGTIGIVGVIPDSLDGANLTENAARIVINDHNILDRDYLVSYLQSPLGQNQIENKTNKVGQPKLALERIKTIEILLPPLAEQQRIAAILREQMAAVERARRAAEEQLEAAKALPATFLRQVFPLPGQPLPAGWRWVRLEEVCEFVRGVSFDKAEARLSPDNGFIPILRAGNIQDALMLEQDLVWVPAKNVSEEQILQVGDIAICMSSGSPDVVGKTAQLLHHWYGSVGAFCGIIRPQKTIVPEWIGHWFRSAPFTEWRDGQARGANIQNLRFSQIQEIEIPLPPLPEQQRIAAILREQMAAAERARKVIEEQLEAINKLPAAILRKAFEGRL